MRTQIYKIIHAFFRIPFFEKILKLFVTGRYGNAFIIRFVPPFNTYPNPTYRLAKKNTLKLHANMHDYNDWKAYWGIIEHERENLYKLAESAEMVIDMGTNNGWVLMNIASIIAKNNGFVYGFEPFPDTYKRCMQNIKSSGITNAQVFNLGCGETENSFEMEVVFEGNSGQNRIVEKTEKEPGKKMVQVNVTTLDKQLGNIKKIDLIKIDVEGFELHVLKGAYNLLKKHRPVIFMEVNDPLLKANNTSSGEVLSFLKTNYNYKITNAANGNLIDEKGNFNNCQLDVICYPDNN